MWSAIWWDSETNTILWQEIWSNPLWCGACPNLDKRILCPKHALQDTLYLREEGVRRIFVHWEQQRIEFWVSLKDMLLWRPTVACSVSLSTLLRLLCSDNWFDLCLLYTSVCVHLIYTSIVTHLCVTPPLHLYRNRCVYIHLLCTSIATHLCDTPPLHLYCNTPLCYTPSTPLLQHTFVLHLPCTSIITHLCWLHTCIYIYTYTWDDITTVNSIRLYMRWHIYKIYWHNAVQKYSNRFN